MGDFSQFVDVVKSGAKDLAKESFGGFQDEASDDARQFLEKSSTDLRRWTKQLANNEINGEDFRDLLDAKKALAEMFSLRQSGIALIKIDRFRKSFINLVVDSAFDVFL